MSRTAGAELKHLDRAGTITLTRTRGRRGAATLHDAEGDDGRPLRVRLWIIDNPPAELTERVRELDRSLQQRLEGLSHTSLHTAPSLGARRLERDELSDPDGPARGLVWALSEDPGGKSLHKVCSRISWSGLAEHAAQALRGLEFLHGQGLLSGAPHRDDWIVNGPKTRRQCLLVEPGLLDLPPLLELVGERPDPRSIAPEVLDGADPDPRSDLFSLGVVLYEAACRHHPFADGRDAMPEPREHRSGLPKGLQDVLLRLLDPDPARRYTSANSVIRDLNDSVRKRFGIEPLRQQLVRPFPLQAKDLPGGAALLDGIDRFLADPDAAPAPRRLLLAPTGVPLERIHDAVRARVRRADAPCLVLRPAPDSREHWLQGLESLRPALLEHARGRALLRRNARVVEALLPEAFPEQSALPELSPGDDLRRLSSALLDLSEGAARILGSLTVLIADLESADPLLCELIRLLQLTPSRGSASAGEEGERGLAPLALIATGRLDECPGRPVEALLDLDAEALGVQRVDALEDPELRHAVAVGLGREPEEVKELADALARRTAPRLSRLLPRLQELCEESTLAAPAHPPERAELKAAAVAVEPREQAARRIERLSEEERDILTAVALLAPIDDGSLAALTDSSSTTVALTNLDLARRGLISGRSDSRRTADRAVADRLLTELDTDRRRELAGRLAEEAGDRLRSSQSPRERLICAGRLARALAISTPAARHRRPALALAERALAAHHPDSAARLVRAALQDVERLPPMLPADPPRHPAPTPRTTLQIEGLVLSGRIEARAGRHRESLAELEQGLALARTERLPELTLDALLALADLDEQQGRSHRAIELAEEARGLAEDLADHRRLAEATRLEARLLEQRGHPHRAIDLLDRQSTDRPSEFRDALLHARLLALCGRTAEAREGLDLALEQAISAEQGPLFAEAHRQLSRLALKDARPGLALQAARKALRLSSAGRDPRGIAISLCAVATARAARGETEEALEDFRSARELARSLADRDLLVDVLEPAGRLCRRLGRADDAARTFEDAIAALAGRSEARELRLQLDLARCHLARGHMSDARAVLDRARARARELRLRIDAIEAARLLAEVALHSGDLSRAESEARDAADDATRLGDRHAEAAARILLGRVSIRLGKLDDACRELREALGLATPLGAWTLIALAQLALGRAHTLLGEPGPALAALEAGREAATTSGEITAEVTSLRELAVFHRLVGRLRQAASCLEAARNLARDSGLHLALVEVELELIDVRLADHPTAGDDSREPDEPDHDSRPDALDIDAVKSDLDRLEGTIRRNTQRGLRSRVELLRARLAAAGGEARQARQRGRGAAEAARIAREALVEIEAQLLVVSLLLSAKRHEEAGKLAEEAHQAAVERRFFSAQIEALLRLTRIRLALGDRHGAALAVREAATRLRSLWSALPEDLRGGLLEAAPGPEVRQLTELVLDDVAATDAGAGPSGAPSAAVEARARVGGASPGGAVADSGPRVESAPDSFRDPLTGVWSHTWFSSQLENEVRRARRHDRPLALLKLNIDRFKLVRELYGSAVARELIKEVAATLLRNLRDVDLVARAFGDEFEVLLPDTPAAGAMLTAQRLRDAVEALNFEHEGERVDATISIGMTQMPRDADSADGLLEKAEEALDGARSRGPNQIASPAGAPAETGEDPVLRDLDSMMLTREGRVLLSMVSRVVNAKLGPEELVRLFTGMVMEATRGRRAFFMTVGPDGELLHRYGRNLDDENVESPELEVSQGIAREVARSGEAMLIEEAVDDERFRDFKSVLDLRLRSIICAPVRFEDEILGVIYVDHNSISRHFTSEDLNFLRAISERMAVPLANALRLDDAERRLREAEERLKASQTAMQTKYRYENIIGRSEPMARVLRLLDRVVDTHHSIVIHGESGTGKELVARAIHFNGPRKDRPFVAENCAAFNPNVLEAELFGHVKGAFTGADQDSKGLFELANGGTLFLDEIGDMSEPMQKKLLRVLQEGEVRPVGGKTVVRVDVRIISASNKDLRKLVNEGAFREDLYYRLNVITVKLPPLRERKDDIPLLVRHFLAKSTPEGDAGPELGREILQALQDYDWPGNIRELENEINRIVAMADGAVALEDLSPKLLESRSKPSEGGEGGLGPWYGRPLKDAEAEIMRELIVHALEQTNWHRTKAAKLLKIPTSTLFNRMKKYDID